MPLRPPFNVSGQDATISTARWTRRRAVGVVEIDPVSLADLRDAVRERVRVDSERGGRELLVEPVAAEHAQRLEVHGVRTADRRAIRARAARTRARAATRRRPGRAPRGRRIRRRGPAGRAGRRARRRGWPRESSAGAPQRPTRRRRRPSASRDRAACRRCPRAPIAARSRAGPRARLVRPARSSDALAEPAIVEESPHEIDRRRGFVGRGPEQHREARARRSRGPRSAPASRAPASGTSSPANRRSSSAITWSCELAAPLALLDVGLGGRRRDERVRGDRDRHALEQLCLDVGLRVEALEKVGP